MNFRGWILCALLIAVAFASPPVAQADPSFEITGCDTLTVDGHHAQRLTFTLHNITSYVAYSFALLPAVTQGDTCHSYSFVAPPAWSGNINPDNGVIEWDSNATSFIAVGGSLPGFQVTTMAPSCCYYGQFGTGFIGATYVFGECTQCPLATPTRTTSWGQLKAVYR